MSERIYPRAPRLESVQDVQTVNTIWRTQAGLSEEQPKDIFTRLMEEVRELDEALQMDNRAELASELADVGLYVFAMMSAVGIDAADALSAKLNRNYHKYNPAIIQEKLASNPGLTQPDAMQTMKQAWDRSHDEQFFEDI